jgi:NADP-dependent 3-hydroxy acid dehydrogenase YdfG
MSEGVLVTGAGSGLGAIIAEFTTGATWDSNGGLYVR